MIMMHTAVPILYNRDYDAHSCTYFIEP